jgi:hypothetical protein
MIMANWWADNKDLLAFVVSLVALGLSLWTTRFSVRANSRMVELSLDRTETLARASTYQRIHELLVDPQAASGRRRLFLAYKSGDFPLLGEEGWDEINYSLALYDTLGGYLALGQVDEPIVLATWHHPLVNIAEPTRAFMEHRRKHGVDQPWTYLHRLIAAAQAYSCTCERPGERPNKVSSKGQAPSAL